MKKRALCRIVLCLMICALLPVQVHAIDRIDLSRDVHLTIHFTHEGQPLPGAELQIYKVADISERGEFSFLEEFAAYPLQFNELEGNDWAAIANTFNSYIKMDNIQPTDTGITDGTGTVIFPRVRKPMEPGLYLITGNTLTYNDVCYTPVPSLVALPNREGDSHQWDYNVTVNMKYTFRTAPSDCRVIKVWKDDGNENKRPDSVEVNLLKDGKVEDTVTLSRDNNWSYTWIGLARENSWTVAEKTVDGYTVSITQEQIAAEKNSPMHTVFNVTNTYTGNEADSKLPQTGSLWWPVPVMLITGLLLIIAGVMRMKGTKDEA